MEKKIKIIATCTTIPTRYEQLEKTLEIIKGQSYPVERIYLTIPKVCPRLNIVYPEPNEKIKSLSEIIRIEKDYGPLTKLYGSLMKNKDPDTYIFSFDDDIIYPKKYLEKLVKFSMKYPNSVVSGAGINVKYGIFLANVHTNLEKVSFLANTITPYLGKEGKKFDIIMGFSGVLYPRKVFPFSDKEIEEFFEKCFYSKNIFLNDDIYISAYLSNKNIDRYVTSDLPYLNNNTFIDKHALSSNFIKMLFSMNKAIKEVEKIGYKWKYNNYRLDEAYIFPYILLIFLILLLILVLYFIMRTKKNLPST